MKKMKAAYLIALAGLVLCFLSMFMPICGSSWSDALGYASTIISIMLGLVSIVYTYKSGEETLAMFDEIGKMLEETKEQNRRLVDKINHELSKDNYDENNIESIRKHIRG